MLVLPNIFHVLAYVEKYNLHVAYWSERGMRMLKARGNRRGAPTNRKAEGLPPWHTHCSGTAQHHATVVGRPCVAHLRSLIPLILLFTKKGIETHRLRDFL